MFKNIGRKIKGFAKFLFWITVISFSIAGLVVLVLSLNSREGMILGIIIGILLVIAGIIIGWLQNFLLYGYGELIDCTQMILEEVERKGVGQPTPSNFSFSEPQPAPQQEAVNPSQPVDKL